MIEHLSTFFRIDLPDLFTFFEEDAVDADVRSNCDRIVIDEKAFVDRLFNAIAEHWFAEERDGVRCGGCGESNADSVEVLKRVAPDACLLRAVSTVALVSND